MCHDWTPEQFRDASYRMGHDHATALLKEGLHPDAVRARLHTVEEAPSGASLGADLWRGVEDALAGLTADPDRGSGDESPTD
jgi:hypothetical protein